MVPIAVVGGCAGLFRTSFLALVPFVDRHLRDANWGIPPTRCSSPSVWRRTCKGEWRVGKSMQLISPSLPSMPVLLGNSPAMAVVRRQVEQAASAGMPVLITGESGTGKNVVAQNLHALSARRDRALVQVNCPSLPHTL